MDNTILATVMRSVVAMTIAIAMAALYISVLKMINMKRLEPENPGVTFCKDCGRKLTQGSPSCVRCGKCARLRRSS